MGYFSASDLASFEYCPRQYYLAKVKRERTESQFSIIGKIEHDVRRVLSMKLLATYSKGVLPDHSVLEEIIESSLNYVYRVAVKEYPSFVPEIEDLRLELEYRISKEQKKREERFRKMLKEHDRLELEAIYEEIPWRVELDVTSNRLGLKGRIDEVYRKGGTLVPVDIKTAPNGFIYRESDSIQLGVYALLLEEKYGICVDEAKIYYTRAGVHHTIEVDNLLRDRVLHTRQKAEEFIQQPSLPPKLKGNERIKCHYCFLRKVCNPSPDEHEGQEWLKILFSQGEGSQCLALFGKAIQ